MDTTPILHSRLVVILTSYNYFDWKPKDEFQLGRKGLSNLAMGTETRPTSTIEKTK
jgi:hypothetical protein